MSILVEKKDIYYRVSAQELILEAFAFGNPSDKVILEQIQVYKPKLIWKNYKLKLK